MFNINFSHNLSENVEKMRKIFSVSKQARIKTLSGIGALLMSKTREYIETEGQGSWEKAHPLTLKNNKKGAYEWLGKMARFVIAPNGYSVIVGFGEFNERAVRNQSHKIKLSSYLSKVSEQMQKGFIIRTTDRMKRKFGAGRRNKKSRIGVDFFPLRKTTKQLKAPSRPVSEPVLKQNRSKIESIVKLEFGKNLQNVFESLKIK